MAATNKKFKWDLFRGDSLSAGKQGLCSLVSYVDSMFVLNLLNYKSNQVTRTTTAKRKWGGNFHVQYATKQFVFVFLVVCKHFVVLCESVKWELKLESEYGVKIVTSFLYKRHVVVMKIPGNLLFA